jgi:predicted MFS family arabinose efflux permease
MTDESVLSDEGRSFEWWMTSNFATGAAFSAFMALLIPPYVTEVTNDAAAAGAVMAIISLAAVLGPVLGTFADRHAAHRIVMSLGVLGMAVGFAAFALASESAKFYAIDSIILGVSTAAVAAVGPVFIVGARLPQTLEARRMTWYSLAMPAGQVAGGAMIGAAAAAGWSFSARFWVASVFCFVMAVVTWLTSKGAEQRLHAAMYGTASTRTGGESDQTDKPRKVPLKAVLWSSFGLFLLVTTLTSVANNGINSQISNIMPKVYGVSEAETSTLISVAGLINIALFVVAGKMMAKRGNIPTYSLGVLLRFIGALGMAVVGIVSGSPALLGIAFMQILYQGSPFARLAQPSTAVRFATFPAGIANGWLIAGSAFGGFIGSLLGGVLADRYGFNAVNWMGAAGAGLSVVVLVLGIWPKRSSGADEEAPAGAGAVAELS